MLIEKAKGHEQTRFENPYLTHIPVLIGLAQLVPIKRVVEFGCGNYSTLTFLNKALFPELSWLLSLENDLAWANQVRKLAQGENRLNLSFVNKKMNLVVSEIQLCSYDLIFIDDSTNAWDRTMTIREVSTHAAQHNIIVIHDAEVKQYLLAAKAIQNCWVCRSFNPCTAVLWNGSTLDKRALRKMSHVLKKNSKRLQPDDRESWLKIYVENRIEQD